MRMSPSRLCSIGLAVLVLVCVSHYAAAQSSPQQVTQTTSLSYSSNPSAVLVSGGFLTGLSSVSSQVFMYTRNPGVPALLSWELEELLTTSNAAPVQSTDGSVVSNGLPIVNWYTATNDDNFIYLSSSHNVWRVEPDDIDKAAAASIELDPDMATPVASFVLSNLTHSFFILSSFGDIRYVAQDLSLPFTGNAKVIEPSVEVPSADGFVSFVKSPATNETAYIAYAELDYFTLCKLSIGQLDAPQCIANVSNAYVPNSSPMVIDAASNILYMLIQNVDADQPLLVALNLTYIESAEELVQLAAAPAATGAKRASGQYGDPIRAAYVQDEDNEVPEGNALALDSYGGQAFVLLSSGVVLRVNTHTLDVVSPALLASSAISNPAGFGMLYFHDAESTLGQRTLLTLTKLSIVTASMATSCPSDCGESVGHGACVAGKCECITGRHGADCSGISCTSDCGLSLGQGNCSLSGQCQCNPEWTFASNCTERQCPSNCFGNGECKSDFTCACSSLWAGSDCSIAAFLACDLFTTEESCVAKFGACGWCADNKKCVSGNLDGPYLGTCRAWYTGGKSQVGLLVAAIVVIVIWGLMLLIGIFSAMPMDYVTAGILLESSLLTTDFLKEAYWRDERSAKTWKMFDLFQFISLYLMIDVSFPTQLVQFARYFNWANLLLPLPYGYEDNKTVHPNRLPTANPASSTTGGAAATFTALGGRNLLNVEQYANSVKVNTEAVFYGTMFWFAILVAAVLLIYVIYAFFMWAFLHRKEPNILTVLIQKFFYVLTRLVLIGYVPINFTAAWHIRGGHNKHPGSIAGAVFAILVFGILPIVFNAIVVWNKGKELLFLYLKLRFGALYSVYHYEKARFNLVVLIRKLIIALVLGFLAAPSTTQGKYVYAQVFIILGLYVLYVIALLAVRPYLDQVHLVLDVVMCVLFAVAFGVAVLHKSSPSNAGQIIAAVCIILVFLACVLAFIHSWYNIIGRNTYPWIMCGPKYSGLDDKSKDDDEELDTAAQIKKKKENEAALAGVIVTKKDKPGKQVDTESSDIDSSLQSTDDEDESDDAASPVAAAPVNVQAVDDENDSSSAEPQEDSDEGDDDEEDDDDEEEEGDDEEDEEDEE